MLKHLVCIFDPLRLISVELCIWNWSTKGVSNWKNSSFILKDTVEGHIYIETRQKPSRLLLAT